MSRPGLTVTRTVARLLVLLTVAVGLLAMHGLASPHHAIAGAPGRAAAALAVESHTTAALVPVQHHAAPAVDMAAAMPSAAILTDLSPATCDDDCPDAAAALCAAVLAVTAAAAALVRAAAGRRALLPAPVGSRPRARAPAHRRLLPEPDPVAELCVSRT